MNIWKNKIDDKYISNLIRTD